MIKKNCFPKETENIADPSSMQDACHILTRSKWPCSLRLSWVGLRFFLYPVPVTVFHLYRVFVFLSVIETLVKA